MCDMNEFGPVPKVDGLEGPHGPFPGPADADIQRTSSSCDIPCNNYLLLGGFTAVAEKKI